MVEQSKTFLISSQRFRLLCFSFLFLYCCGNYSATARQGAVSDTLELNAQFTKELAKDESHTYLLNLQAGQFVKTRIETSGTKIRIDIYDPLGELIGTWMYWQPTQVPLSITAKNTGLYRLIIRSLEKPPFPHRYSIQVVERRAAVPKDNLRMIAESLFSQGEQLRTEGFAEPKKKAIRKYQLAIKNQRAVANKREETFTLSTIGDTYLTLGEYKKALEYFTQALLLSREIHDQTLEVNLLNAMAYTHVYLGDLRKAFDCLTKAISGSQSLKYQFGETQSLFNFGEYYYSSGEYSKAIEFYNQSLFLAQGMKNVPMQAQAFLMLCHTYIALTNKENAFECYEKALSLWRMIEDSRGVALTLIAGAAANITMGNKLKAVSLYSEAIKILHQVGDKFWETNASTGLGFAYEVLGDSQRALFYYENAINLFRSLGIRQSIALGLIRTGELYILLEQNSRALECFKQVEEINSLLKDKYIEALLKHSMGKLLESKGNKEKAFDYYNQALMVNQEIGKNRIAAYVMNSIGNLYHSNGEKLKAFESFKQAIQLNKKAGDQFGEVSSLYNLSHVERDLSYANEAREHIEEAIRLAESLRDHVKGPEFRTSYFATVQKSFDLYIDLLMQRHKQNPASGFDVQALESSERARARTFLESLLESRVNIRKGVDLELLQREKEIKQKIDEKANYRDQLLAKLHTEKQINAINVEISELMAEQEQVRAHIRDANPNYSTLTFTQPIRLKEIQELLDPDTLLLEYRLGEERSYLWLVSQNEAKSYELPARKVIEKEARQVLIGFTSPQTQKADLDVQPAVDRLSHMLLGQVADSVKAKRLLIIADGVLQYVPFAALTSPNSSQEKVPLIVEHEIINLSSASVLAALRKEYGDRPAAPKSIAVIADPVLTKEDVYFNLKNRSPETTAPNPSFNREFVRAFSETGGKTKRRTIERLPFAREEADNILKLVTDGSALKVVEFDASLAKVKSLDLQKYRFIHFATHGLANNENPYLSGIVLSLFDENGRPQDGFLRLQDISELKLTSELVVLSACQTAIGKEFRGEGLISLTRGFMQAGSKRVLASLWNVNDAVTADLMKRFYQGMLVDGLSPARALRAAQIAMWKQKNKSAPYYWAAFVLEGEWQ